MPSLKDIHGGIGSVRNTAQITRAMRILDRGMLSTVYAIERARSVDRNARGPWVAPRMADTSVMGEQEGRGGAASTPIADRWLGHTPRQHTLPRDLADASGAGAGAGVGAGAEGS
jgi:hypothetical protein